MIKNLENFNKKSFKNYTGPNEEFVKKNIIFGYNGRGKSALAEGICEEYLKNGSENNLRYFNRKYVADNLLIDTMEDSRIKGVIANFGEKNVNRRKEINDLQTQLIGEVPIRESIVQDLDDITKACNEIFDNKKGNLSIHKKSSIDFDELLSSCNGVKDNMIEAVIKKKILSAYEEDVSNAKKYESDEDKLLNYRGDSSIENKRKIIEEIRIDELQGIDNAEIKEVVGIILKRYENINIPSDRIITWINEGLDIHKENDKCKFCGGRIDLEDIKSNVEKYCNDEKQKDSQKLKEFRSKLDRINAQIENVLLLKKLLISALDDSISAPLADVASNKILIDRCKEKINEKLDGMEKQIEFEFDKFCDSLNAIKIAFDKIIEVKKELKEKLIVKENNMNTLIKGSIGLEITRSSYIKNKVNEAGEQIIKYKTVIEKNNKIKTKIEELKQVDENTKDFADFISNILISLEINLKLDLENKDYIIKHSKTDETISIYDISEGEQNLLALLYFFYELFTDKNQTEFKANIELIILDDPISSVDNVNRMYVLELVKRIINLENEMLQIFVFTHVWDDFIEMCYGKDKDVNYNFYEVRKSNSESYVYKTKVNQTPYKHSFKEVYEFSKKSDCDDLNECEIYHYPNIMRKVLEEYLSFKAVNSSPTNSNRNVIKTVLCGDKCNPRDDLDLGVLLNVCNVLSHKASRNPDEILKAAKFLMLKIEKMDKLHFDAMKQ